jgi:hypothetical protein
MTKGLAWFATVAVAEVEGAVLVDMAGHPDTERARIAQVRQCAIL